MDQEVQGPVGCQSTPGGNSTGMIQQRRHFFLLMSLRKRSKAGHNALASTSPPASFKHVQRQLRLQASPVPFLKL